MAFFLHVNVRSSIMVWSRKNWNFAQFGTNLSDYRRVGGFTAVASSVRHSIHYLLIAGFNYSLKRNVTPPTNHIHEHSQILRLKCNDTRLPRRGADAPVCGDDGIRCAVNGIFALYRCLRLSLRPSALRRVMGIQGLLLYPVLPLNRHGQDVHAGRCLSQPWLRAV